MCKLPDHILVRREEADTVVFAIALSILAVFKWLRNFPDPDYALTSSRIDQSLLY